MITVLIYSAVAVGGIWLGKKYGSYLSKSAVEAEFAKVEAVATADVKNLITKVRSVL